MRNRGALSLPNRIRTRQIPDKTKVPNPETIDQGLPSWLVRATGELKTSRLSFRRVMDVRLKRLEPTGGIRGSMCQVRFGRSIVERSRLWSGANRSTWNGYVRLP